MTRSCARTRFGPGGKVYVVVAALLIVMAVYTQFNLLILLVGLMGGGLICSLLLSWLMLRNITVHRIVPGHGVVGKAMVVRYRIFNGNRRVAAFALQIGECGPIGNRIGCRTASADRTPNPLAGPQGWVLHVGPNQTVQCEATIWPTHRGSLQFERIRIDTSFPFGLIRRIVEFAQEGKALVYPHIYRINRRLLYHLAFMDSAGNRQPYRGSGHDETLGLRKYREGDSLKIIDWKHTAKTGELICRDLTRPRLPRIMLGLDLTAGDPPDDDAPTRHKDNGMSQNAIAIADDVERMVSLAASIVCDTYLRGYQIGLTVMGGGCNWFPTHHSLPHRTRLLEALATLNVDGPMRPVQLGRVRPTVIIRAGRSVDRGTDKPLILGIDQITQYVDDAAIYSAGILDRRPGSARREDSMQAQTPWT